MVLIALPGRFLQKLLSILLARADTLLPRPLLVILTLGKLLKIHNAFNVV